MVRVHEFCRLATSPAPQGAACQGLKPAARCSGVILCHPLWLVLGMVTAGVPSARGENVLRIVLDPTRVTIQAGDRPVLQYRYAVVPYKPYVEQIPSPGGIQVLRDSPFDHKHHHSLMFAVAVDKVNFWEETPAAGRQAHKGFSRMDLVTQAGVERAVFTENLDWINPRESRVLLQESRTIETYQAADLGASLATWRSRFTLPPGKASADVSGSEYFGLGVRFLQSMDTGGAFVNADGKTGVAGTNAARSAWCAYSAKADGKPVTIAVFDHPTNPRYPATWFTMDKAFAYLAATLNLAKEPLVVKADKPLELQYGVAVWDGTIAAEPIRKLYERWVALLTPPPSRSQR